MPLILLTYEVSAAGVQKANRLWAADSIQSRRVLYLPVAECGIHPERRTCETPQGEWPPPAIPFVENVDHVVTTHDTPLKGDESSEWVDIPGVGTVQIISLPQSKLSYFPTNHRHTMERSTSLPSLLHSPARDSMDSVASLSSIGSVVEDGIGWLVRSWHDNRGRRKWAQIAKQDIELLHGTA
jgi:hypothetical protein